MLDQADQDFDGRQKWQKFYGRKLSVPVKHQNRNNVPADTPVDGRPSILINSQKFAKLELFPNIHTAVKACQYHLQPLIVLLVP